MDLGRYEIMRYLLIASLLVLATPGTAGAASPSPTPSVSPGPSPGTVPLPGELRINEFLPNPIGTDTGNEWVELANVSAHDLTVGGVVVARISGSTLLTVPAGTVVRAGEVLLVNQLSGSIVNSGDTVILKSGLTELDRVTYDANGQEGWSWSRLSATEGGWSSLPTPGVVNPADVPEDDSGNDADTGGGSGTSSSATTKASATTAKASTAKSTAKTTAAKKLPTGGPGPVPYLALPVLGMLYWYARRRFL